MPSYNINKYQINCWSSRPTTPSTGVGMCSINFYKDNTYRGKATFYSDGTELVPPKFDSNVGTVILAFNLSQFHAIVDMMREEKPIWVYYWNPRNAGIQTGLEPTGEEE